MRDLLLILSGAFAASIAWLIAIYGEKILRRWSWQDVPPCAQCKRPMPEENAILFACPICMIYFCSELCRRTHMRRAACRLPEDLEGCSVEPGR